MTAMPATLPTSAPQTLLTADEFAVRYENIHAELIKGVVEEYPVPFAQHGKVCMTFGALLWHHVETHDLGHVMGNDTWIRTGQNPDTVRGADVCYFSYERLPKGEIPKGLLPVVPDLVAEVRSPTDRWGVLFAKVGEYLNVGVRVVVILDPDTGTVSVYRHDEFQQIFHNGDEVTIPDVLPGFTVKVQRLLG